MSVDIESNSLLVSRYKDAPEHKIWSVGLYSEKEEEFIKCDSGCYDYVNERITLAVENGIILVFHNAAFDVAALRLRGVDIPVNRPNKIYWIDTMLMSYCLSPSGSQYHSLEALAYLVDETKYDAPIFKDPDFNTLKRYNLQDCKITYKLARYFLPILYEDELNWEFFLLVEQPYTELIMELQKGVMIDRLSLANHAKELEVIVNAGLAELRSQIGPRHTEPVEYSKKILFSTETRSNGSKKYTFVGYYDYTEKNPTGHQSNVKIRVYDHCPLVWFNPNSPDDLSDWLFSAGHKPTSYTKGGKVKTDEKTLRKIAHKFPLLQKILDWKKLENHLTTFVHPIGEKLDSDSILYASFNQCQVVTRRLSSSNPNLQNIPARGPGASIRRMFIPRNGCSLVVGDLDRIEVCVLGFYLELLYGDKTISDAIRAGVDVHQINADVWGIERAKAKNTLFCIIYGGGEQRISETAQVSIESAKKILRAIERRLPALLEFREDMVNFVEENEGYFNDYLGALYYVPEILSSNNKVYHAAARQIGNYFIQGTAGSLFKVLQLKAAPKIQEFSGRLLIVVHDEAVYEISQSLAQEAAILLTETYSDSTLLATEDFYVPISAVFSVHSNWLEAKNK